VLLKQKITVVPLDCLDVVTGCWWWRDRNDKLSADDVMHEADTLYDQWPTLASEDKRKVMEALVEKVTIGNGEIDITFSCVPSEDVCKSQQRLGPESGCA
jgi:hypothetical protein